jgi:hypothetical protein
MRGLYTALSRKTREGTPPDGWLPDQAVSLESALRHYTIDGAFASFEEDLKGSIAPGKLADLAVLSEDLFEVPADAILRTRVVLTVLGGEVVYRDAAALPEARSPAATSPSSGRTPGGPPGAPGSSP